MIVKNTDQDIEVAYEGITYIFKKDELVKVEDGVGQFVTEKYPLSFSYGKQLQAKEAKDVETYKTKAYIPKQATDIRKSVDELPVSGGIDSDGMEWYGEGVQIEN